MGRLAKVVGVALTFALALVAGVVLHLDRPAARRAIGTQIGHVLAPMFLGQPTVERIGALGLGGIDGVHLSVRDGEGVPVLSASDIRVRIGTTKLLRSLLFGSGPIDVPVTAVSIGHVDVNLDGDAEGNLRIAKAFEARGPSTPKTEPAGRDVHVAVPSVRLAHAWIHGTPPGALLVDADLSALEGHASVVGPDVFATLDNVGLVTRALPREANPRGNIRGTFAMPAANGQGMDVIAVFDGATFGIPTTLDVRMNDCRVDARLDARDSTGVRTGAAVSELDIRDPLSIHLEVHGDLPEIEGVATVALGAATVEANAVVEATRSTRIRGRVSARDVDVAALVAGGPKTQLGLDARANVVVDGDSRLFGDAAIDTLAGVVDGRAIPPAEIRGAFEGEAARVRAKIRDERMPTDVAIDVTPRAGGPDSRTVSAIVRSRIDDLRRLPTPGIAIEGSANVEASARLVLPEQAIEQMRLEVNVSGLRNGGLAIDGAKVIAKASGSIDHPVIDAEVHGRELGISDLAIASLDAKARIERSKDAITIRDAKVDAVRPLMKAVTASARLVRLQGRNILASGVEILGIGEPIHADFAKSGRDLRASVDAPKIDLPLAARLAGKGDEVGVTSGTFGLAGEAVVKGGVPKGKVHASVDDLTIRSVRHGKVTLDVGIDDRNVDVDMFASVGKAGKIAVRTEKVVLGGHFDDIRAWKAIAGKVQITGDIDMARASRLVPPESLPVADLRGSLALSARAGRDHPDAPPEVQLHVHTNGLGVSSIAAPAETVSGIVIEMPASLRASDFDIGIDVGNDGQSGLTNVAFRATDTHGVIIAADAKAILPYAALVRDPAAAPAALVEAPFNVKVTVPPRRLDQSPSIFAPAGLTGAMAADLDASGTLLEPRVHLAMRARRAHSAGMPGDFTADADATLDYDGRAADVVAKVRSGGKDLAELEVHADARVKDFVAASKQGTGPLDVPWTGSAHARLAAFPLESVPELALRRVRGDVSGEVMLEGLHQDARLKGQLLLERFGVGAADYERGSIVIDTSGGKLVAQVRVDQKDGNFDARASSGLTWGRELAPSLDGQPITARLVAHGFRAAAIQPFVESAVPALDGRIDANATARLSPGQPGAALGGTVSFHDGTLLVAALGEELRGVRAAVKLEPDGTIRVTDVAARGTQGEVHADATVKLDGTRVSDATANIRIPEGKPLALALQGSPIGQLAGALSVKARQSEDGNDTRIVVEIPRLGVELPQVTKTGVQGLGEKKNVRVGVHRGRQRFVELPFDPEDARSLSEQNAKASTSRLDVDVRLGRIRIKRGNQLEVELSGNPKITVEGESTKIEGQVSVARGWVDVQGKKFEIERGTVTFNGESPPNPVIVATAGWTAADSSRIFADFVGPVTTGKVTLRSEPPRPQNEILAMVLFGTADGANPPPPQANDSGSTAKTAAGLGGGYLAQGLTEALDDLGGVKATARIDTTESNNPRPEISFQLSPKVSIGFAHVLGTPPITDPDRNLANFEYRFRRNWSAQTTFGDRGTTLVDAIWQKRY